MNARSALLGVIPVALAVIGIACAGEGNAPAGGGTDAARDQTRTPETTASRTRPAFDSASVAGLTCLRFTEEVLAVEPTRAALRRQFGDPDSIAATTEPNRHIRDATDSLFVVHYPGLVVHIRTPPSGRDLASEVEVSQNRYLSYPAIGIGAPAERVESVLGAPRTRQNGAFTYECGEHVEQPITFRTRDGVVERIHISFYVD